MSVEALSFAIKQKTGGSLEKIVLLVLANYSDADGISWPSHSHISRVCEISESSVKRALRNLEEKQIVEKMSRFRTDGSQSSNFYKIKLGGRSDRPPAPILPDPPKIQKKETKEYTDKFLLFWEAYPRKDGSKLKSFESFEKIIASGVDTDLIIKRAKDYAWYASRDKTPLKYLPHATTWLNQKRFETVEEPNKAITKNSLAG